jgi:hypothetical protein
LRAKVGFSPVKPLRTSIAEQRLMRTQRTPANSSFNGIKFRFEIKKYLASTVLERAKNLF